MRPELTIGMPTHTDAYGVWATVQALRLFHPDVMPVTELLVIDQNPDSQHGKDVKNFMGGWVKTLLHSSRYLAAPEPRGSAPAKERVFQESSGEIVICVDSHVFMWPESLSKTLAYFAENPESKDLLAGPMIYDNLVSGSTHLTDYWSGEQWGTWAEARRCTACGSMVDIFVDTQEFKGQLRYRSPRDLKSKNGCPGCSKTVNPTRGRNLEESMTMSGFSQVLDGEGEPFEIAAHGTGLICCRKDAWAGFPEGMYGFGAEEWILHERWRQKHPEGKVLCAPWLRWTHRFLRPDGPKYTLSRFEKVRNFVIGFKDIGKDLKPIHEHFVATGLLSEDDWNAILNGAKEPMRQAKPGCSTCPKVKEKADASKPLTLELWYERAWKTPHDINEHCPTLRELASHCKHVTEFGMRHGISTVALLVGVQEKLVSYDIVKYGEVDALTALSEGKFEFRQGSSLTVDIDETDMLFIDTVHTEKQVAAELARHAGKVKRYLVFHDTVIYGDRGEDGGPGLLPAIRAFLSENSEWTVIRHDRNNNGLMILSRDVRDKKPLPGTITMAFNYAKALTRRVTLGGDATEEQYKRRLEICSLCPSRTNERCAECGCPIQDKASWATEQCPLNKWKQEGV